MKAVEHIELLGCKVTDKISGVTGIITSISFDLYGCIQAAVDQGMKEDGTRKDTYWIDVTRIKKITAKRVMPLPDFVNGYIAEGKKGPAYKPDK